MTFYPLKTMIRCSFCGHNMYVGPSTGSKGKRYLNYRCDYRYCTRNKKSIRAKEIFNWIYDFLDKYFKLTEDDYKHYYDCLTILTDKNRENIRIQIHSREAGLRKAESEIRELSLSILKPQKPIVKQQGEIRLGELTGEKAKLEKEIDKLKRKLTNPDNDKLSLEQFLNLSKEAGMRVRSGNPIQKDAICRQIFLNLTVNEDKVLSYQLKPHSMRW